ncbi:MAG: hypothetical protein WCO56_28745 [Verrucomicrobiota bacterium]
MFTTRTQIREALSRTGRCLALADAGEYSLLVCGGSALCLSGLRERPTRDVDILGMVKGDAATVLAEPLPDEVTRAAALVARDLNLPENWLNDAALAVHRLGLPAGILSRATKQVFGPCLTIYLIGRQDQVALKLYAAIDGQKGKRHFEDLAAIEPTRKEMEFAVRWLLDRKTSLEFQSAIRRVADALDFPKLVAAPAEPSSPQTQRGRTPGSRPASLKVPKNCSR